MSKVLTSIGAVLSIASETTAGQRPTTGYKHIPQVTEMTEIDLDPDTIETTSFDNLRYKSSVAGLIDTSALQSLTVNATKNEDAETVWDAAAQKYATDGTGYWLQVAIRDKDDAVFIPIAPVETGAYNLVVNDVVTIALKYTITGDLEFAAKVEPDAA